MTREQAKKEAFIETNMANTSGIVWVTDTFVDKIYDDFESEMKDCEWRVELALAQVKSIASRTCGNCKMYLDGFCYREFDVETIDGLGTVARIEVTDNFGCNKWIQKDD